MEANEWHRKFIPDAMMHPSIVAMQLLISSPSVVDTLVKCDPQEVGYFSRIWHFRVTSFIDHLYYFIIELLCHKICGCLFVQLIKVLQEKSFAWLNIEINLIRDQLEYCDACKFC